jgi:hypothetical protein
MLVTDLPSLILLDWTIHSSGKSFSIYLFQRNSNFPDLSCNFFVMKECPAQQDVPDSLQSVFYRISFKSLMSCEYLARISL